MMAKSLYALVGMQHLGTVGLVAALPAGEPLTLIREPDNQYDPEAVQVWARGRHAGYIKALQVRPLAAAMDAAIEKAKIAPSSFLRPAKLAVDGGRWWPMVEVDE